MLAIGIGDGPDTMHRALDLAHQHPQIFATAGIHPQEAHQATPENLAKLAALAEDPRCIAVGEIGLDYYHLDNPDIATQQAAFVAQMEIAAARPQAHHDPLPHLRARQPAAKAKLRARPTPGRTCSRLIAEHWTPTGLPRHHALLLRQPEQAERSLAAGFYLSFAGNLTYPKSQRIQEAARRARDRILVETDAPFLRPIPHRGQRNEPACIAPHRSLPRRAARHLTAGARRADHRKLPHALPVHRRYRYDEPHHDIAHSQAQEHHGSR